MMYYHIYIKSNNLPQPSLLFNIESKDELVDEIIKPLFTGKSVIIGSNICRIENMETITIKESKDTSSECVNIYKGESLLDDSDEFNCIFSSNTFAIDITQATLNEFDLSLEVNDSIQWAKLFIGRNKSFIDKIVTVLYYCTLFLYCIPLLFYIGLIVYLFTSIEWPGTIGISAIIGLVPPILILVFKIVYGTKISIAKIRDITYKFWESRIYKKWQLDKKYFANFNNIFH